MLLVDLVVVVAVEFIVESVDSFIDPGEVVADSRVHGGQPGEATARPVAQQPHQGPAPVGTVPDDQGRSGVAGTDGTPAATRR